MKPGNQGENPKSKSKEERMKLKPKRRKKPKQWENVELVSPHNGGISPWDLKRKF